MNQDVMNAKIILRLSVFVLVIAMLSCKKTSAVIPDVSVSPVPSTPEEIAEALEITLPAYSIVNDTTVVENGLTNHVVWLVFDNPIDKWTESVVKSDTSWVENSASDGYIKEVQSVGAVNVEKTMIGEGMTVTYDILVHGYISPEHNGIKLITLDNSEKVKSDLPFQP